MSDSRYPLPVERFEGEQAVLVICESCGGEAVIDPDDMVNDGFYECPLGCGGAAVYKYAEADKCPGCGALGWYEDTLKHACSRRCMLQAEYAATLKDQTA